MIFLSWFLIALIIHHAASVLKEKLLSLGSSGILADHQLQAQLQEHHLKGLVGSYSLLFFFLQSWWCQVKLGFIILCTLH